MATKADILARRSDLKSFMISNRYEQLTFKEIKNFYNNDNFIDKYGFLSDSRIREDLKSLGIYPTKENLYSIDVSYDIDSVEVSISKALNYFNLYRPVLIGEPLDVDFNDDSISDDLWLYSVILKRKHLSNKSDSKFSIDYLINNLHKFYKYTSINEVINCFEIIKGSTSVQFLFDDYDNMDNFYRNLLKWKKSLTLDFKKK